MSVILVIVNPIAGGASPAAARARADLASRTLAARGIDGEVVLTERPGHARELAAAAVVRGVDRVCAWGGDGTINEVASALVCTGVPLAIVPAGSGNGLARELGIPLRPERALAHALDAPPRPIDAGEIDGRLFVNMAGIGFDAYIAATFNAPTNRRRGLAVYARLTVGALVRYIPSEYVIETAERRWTTRALLLAIANSPQWGNNARIAPGALVDDGKLDLVVVADRSPWSIAWHIPRLFTGTVSRIRGCTIDRIEAMTIASDREIAFHVDGEPCVGGTRVDVRVRPGALHVCA